VIGTHTLKFGGQFHYDQINQRNLAAENGQYQFSGSETDIDFADFLIGAPNNLTRQASNYWTPAVNITRSLPKTAGECNWQ
jgi:hypothetical protein